MCERVGDDGSSIGRPAADVFSVLGGGDGPGVDFGVGYSLGVAATGVGARGVVGADDFEAAFKAVWSTVNWIACAAGLVRR